MSGVATAIAGAAVIGAVASRSSTKKSIEASERAAQQSSSDINQSTEKARSDLLKLFPAGEQNANLGFQSALNVFGQSAPAQAQAFQQGNIGAQQQLLAGLPLQQAATLGQNVDFSQLQPFQLPEQDLGFLQQRLPEFRNTSQALGIAGVSNDPQRPPVPNVGAPLPVGVTQATNPISSGLAGAFMGGTGRGGFNPRRP